MRKSWGGIQRGSQSWLLDLRRRPRLDVRELPGKVVAFNPQSRTSIARSIAPRELAKAASIVGVSWGKRVM